MLQQKDYPHYIILFAAVLHMMLYAFLLFSSIKFNFQDSDNLITIIGLMIIAPLLAGIGFFHNRIAWFYSAFVFSLPNLYFGIAGNGYLKWFIFPTLIFLGSAISFQIEKRTKLE